MATIPTSQADICNMALDYLGNKAVVTDIESPSTKEEVICQRWYDVTRRQLLRKYVWNFASKRATISRNATAPEFGFADAYDLPNDYIRLRFIGDDYIGDFKRHYELENGQLLLDNGGEASLNIGYSFDQTVVTKFDALFTNLLALQLALNMAKKFTLKNTDLQRLILQYEMEEQKAVAVDGQDKPPKRVERSKYRRARRGLYGKNVAGPYTTFEG